MDTYRLARIGPWAVYRLGPEYTMTKLGNVPGSEWTVLQEWPLDVIRTRTRDELVAELLARFPPEVPQDTARRLAEAVVRL